MGLLEKDLMPVELEAPGQEWLQCDSCPQKAWVHIYLPVGHLYFCHHHYNKHAEALIGGGAKAVRIYSEIGI